MLYGALIGLGTAWVLSIFGFNTMAIEAAKQFGFTIDNNTYYVLFILIGAIGGAFKGEKDE
ncbi:hypothetical protein [Clostridium sp. B9]|uniref:hypothetical protein n=1 Tax=Clostridium sp. B9 TaxID=3423224 RepID=UPI003D2EDAA9